MQIRRTNITHCNAAITAIFYSVTHTHTHTHDKAWSALKCCLHVRSYLEILQQVHVMQCTVALPISEVEDDPQSSCPHFNAFMVQVNLYALASYTCYGIPVLFAACTIEIYIFAYTDPLTLFNCCSCCSICCCQNKHECALPDCQADMYLQPCFSSNMFAEQK